VKERRVDLTGIGSLAEAYDRFQRTLELPDHFGRNLDALWDALTTDVAGPFAIVWSGSHALGADGERLRTLLEELGQRRKDVSLRLD
jgi:ribonuclease inhibitor